MGLLEEGHPLSFEKTHSVSNHVRKHALIQFIHFYEVAAAKKEKDRFLWGDELELTIVIVDHEKKLVKLDCKAFELLEKLKGLPDVAFHPEYATYMLEAIPQKPFTGEIAEIVLVEENMRKRRMAIQGLLKEDQMVLSLTCFPLLGVGDFCCPFCPVADKERTALANSEQIHDDIITPMPRFQCITQNVIKRRGSHVEIKIKSDGKEFEMDAPVFGCGLCCLQVTFQCPDLMHTLLLFDQMVLLSPIMLAMTASTPFVKGKVVDTDVRWFILAQSIDDRNVYERGLRKQDQSGGVDDTFQLIPKSRYGSVDGFIGTEEFNDILYPIDKVAFAYLLEKGVTPSLAKHIAHMCIREPLLVMEEKVNQDDMKDDEHWHNVETSLWQTVRFKAPSADGAVGYRVELRPMEICPTDFENAAFTCFSALLAKAILHFKIHFYMNISKVDENMEISSRINAVVKEKFWWKSKLVPLATIFAELMELVRRYLDQVADCTQGKPERQKLEQYFTFLERRATGEDPTPATWMRDMLHKHPDYKNDHNVPPSFVYDMVIKISEMNK